MNEHSCVHKGTIYISATAFVSWLIVGRYSINITIRPIFKGYIYFGNGIASHFETEHAVQD